MEYILILITCLLVYSLSWNYQPICDDIASRDKHKNNPRNHFHRRLLERIRRRFNGQTPFENLYLDRALTVLIHTIVCLLIYKAFGSLAAALLFAFNVSNNQVSLWLNGKRYGIATLFCLLSYIYAPLGILFWFLTPFFQASAASFPLILALKGYWYFLLFPPLALIIGNKFLLKWMRGRMKGLLPEVKTWKIQKISFILKTFTFYFFRSLFPFAPVMAVSYLRLFGVLNEETKKAYKFDIASLFGLILLISIPLLYIWKPYIFFGLMWWMITTAVYSNWITATVPFAERYCYLPNVGMMLTLAKILSYIHPYAWFFVCGIYLSRLLTYMPIFKNLEAYLTHHTNTDPTNDWAWNIRIQEALFAQDAFKALRLVDESLTYIKDSPRLWVHKAALTYSLGGHKEALNYFQKARESAIDGFREQLLAKINETERLTYARNKEKQDGFNK